MTMKSTIKALTILSVLALPLAAPAFANHDGEGKKHHHKFGFFDKLDTDKDGAISKAEHDAQFARLDLNGDGKITKEEWTEHMKKMREAHKAKKAEEAKEAEAAKPAETPTETKK